MNAAVTPIEDKQRKEEREQEQALKDEFNGDLDQLEKLVATSREINSAREEIMSKWKSRGVPKPIVRLALKHKEMDESERAQYDSGFVQVRNWIDLPLQMDLFG